MTESLTDQIGDLVAQLSPAIDDLVRIRQRLTDDHKLTEGAAKLLLLDLKREILSIIKYSGALKR